MAPPAARRAWAGLDLSTGLNPGLTFTNVPGGTAHWTFTGGTNYANQNGDVAIAITARPLSSAPPAITAILTAPSRPRYRSATTDSAATSSASTLPLRRSTIKNVGASANRSKSPASRSLARRRGITRSTPRPTPPATSHRAGSRSPASPPTTNRSMAPQRRR